MIKLKVNGCEQMMQQSKKEGAMILYVTMLKLVTAAQQHVCFSQASEASALLSCDVCAYIQ